MRKIWIALVILSIGGCKDDDISLSKDFEGTFYSSQKNNIGVVAVEWTFSSAGPKTVDLVSKAEFKSSVREYDDETRIVSITGVNVETEKALKFDNKYSYDGETFYISGRAKLVGDKLTIDVKETASDGSANYTAIDMYRR